MKVSMLALSLLAFSTAASAGDPVDHTLAIEYLTVSRIEDVLNASIDEYDEQLFKDVPAEARVGLRKLLEDSMGWNATKDQLAELTMALYTREELEASIAFMKSPAGASATAKNGEFSKRFTNIAATNLQKALLACCSETK